MKKILFMLLLILPVICLADRRSKKKEEGPTQEELLRQIETPVYLLYGDADNIVPIAHGEHLAERLPNADFRIRPGEGHLGGLGASEEIFDDLLAHWPSNKKTSRRGKKIEVS